MFLHFRSLVVCSNELQDRFNCREKDGLSYFRCKRHCDLSIFKMVTPLMERALTNWRDSYEKLWRPNALEDRIGVMFHPDDIKRLTGKKISQWWRRHNCSWWFICFQNAEQTSLNRQMVRLLGRKQCSCLKEAF